MGLRQINFIDNLVEKTITYGTYITVSQKKKMKPNNFKILQMPYLVSNVVI